jgi:hypothetical protein
MNFSENESVDTHAVDDHCNALAPNSIIWTRDRCGVRLSAAWRTVTFMRQTLMHPPRRSPLMAINDPQSMSRRGRLLIYSNFCNRSHNFDIAP